MRRWLHDAALVTFHALVARPLLWFLGVRYRRRALVPRGPCLMVANHNSHLDAAVLMSLFPLRRLPRVHPVAAADYFGQTWLRRTMAMLFMNAIAIARRPQQGDDPLGGIVRGLEAGDSFIFFPEGSRGEPGVVAPFRPGIGRLVRTVPGVLVVPVFMSGAERIWPRGEAIPVPFGIDVQVGRPRTYRRDRDAAAIASEVRDDVLALAPPAKPVPGRRPSPPLRVAICSIEPTLRRQVFQATVERLGRIDRTVGVSHPTIEADASGVRELARVPLVRSRAWVVFLGWLFRTGGIHRGSKFAEMVERARTDEALHHGRGARHVVTEGSALVDLVAWAEADFYSGAFDESEMKQLLGYLSGQRRIPLRQWPRFIRSAPEVWLLNVLDLARPAVPDVLVLLRMPPARALERIRSTGEPLEPYQTAAFLERLQEAYVWVSLVLRRRRVQVIEVDAAAAAAEEVAQRLVEACAARTAEASA